MVLENIHVKNQLKGIDYYKEKYNCWSFQKNWSHSSLYRQKLDSVSPANWLSKPTGSQSVIMDELETRPSSTKSLRPIWLYEQVGGPEMLWACCMPENFHRKSGDLQISIGELDVQRVLIEKQFFFYSFRQVGRLQVYTDVL